MTEQYEITIFQGSNEVDPYYDNVDVEILFVDGRRYSATFFTLENLRLLLDRYRDTGECRRGLYIWAKNMIIARELTREAIAATVEDLLRTGEFFSAFSEPMVE